MVVCPGCGAAVPKVEEMRQHPYIGPAPGCWLLYSEVLAREYGDIRYTPAHQLTVDAHAVQHPGLPERRTAQSVAIHLVGLCLSLERGRAPAELPRLRQRLAPPKRTFPWLTPPASRGDVTVVDVHAAEPRRPTGPRWTAGRDQPGRPGRRTTRGFGPGLMSSTDATRL